MREIEAMFPGKSSSWIVREWLKYGEGRRVDQPQTRWYHGPGSEKAAAAWLEQDGDMFVWRAQSTTMLSGYDAHNALLIVLDKKNMRKVWLGVKCALNGEHRVSVGRQTTRQLLAGKVAIAAPFPPKDAILDCKGRDQENEQEASAWRVQEIIECA